MVNEGASKEEDDLGLASEKAPGSQHVGSLPDWVPILVPPNLRCRNIIHNQKGSII